MEILHTTCVFVINGNFNPTVVVFVNGGDVNTYNNCFFLLLMKIFISILLTTIVISIFYLLLFCYCPTGAGVEDKL